MRCGYMRSVCTITSETSSGQRAQDPPGHQKRKGSGSGTFSRRFIYLGLLRGGMLLRQNRLFSSKLRTLGRTPILAVAQALRRIRRLSVASRYFVLAGAFVCYGRAVVVTQSTSIVNWSQLAFAWWLRQLSLATVHV